MQTQSLATTGQIAFIHARINRAEEPQSMDGAGIIYGLLLASSLWLIGAAVAFLMVW